MLSTPGRFPILTTLAVVAGCVRSDGPAPPDPLFLRPESPTPTPDTAATLPPTPPTPTAPTGDTGTLPTFDCSKIPELPDEAVQLKAPRGYNDLVFDADGAMIGSDTNVLIRATSADDAEVYATGIGTIYKMGVLPNGDIVAARSAGAGADIVRIDATGGSAPLGTGMLAYGLAVGSDGLVYAATNYTANGEAIVRIDPDTGEWEILVDAGAFPPRAIAFGRGEERLYWGTLSGGDVYGIDLDENLDPVGDPELVTTVPEGWHDTLEVDACGNLYVGTFFGAQIYRVETDGTGSVLLSWNTEQYGHGFEWGRAEGGWNDHAIYLTHPYIGSRVSEVDIGVPSAQWPGVVIGGGSL